MGVLIQQWWSHEGGPSAEMKVAKEDEVPETFQMFVISGDRWVDLDRAPDPCRARRLDS